jgi:hypothetical protein
MDIHLYLSCYGTEALIASHLPAEQFGAYMAVGPLKKSYGNVVFFEIDPTLRMPELHLDRVEELCVPHGDGSPRRSKYMSHYRVMEFIPRSAYGKLHLTTRDGRVMPLEGQDCDMEPQTEGLHLYAELCPITSRVVSKLNPAAFIQQITDPKSNIFVPRIFFADTMISLDAEGNLESFLPYRNPEHIAQCVKEIQQNREKLAKTVNRNSPLTAFYRTIGSGFYLGDVGGIKFYPYPDAATLDADHHEWWRSATLG